MTDGLRSSDELVTVLRALKLELDVALNRNKALVEQQAAEKAKKELDAQVVKTEEAVKKAEVRLSNGRKSSDVGDADMPTNLDRMLPSRRRRPRRSSRRPRRR